MQAHAQDEVNWLVIGGLEDGDSLSRSRRSVLVVLIHLSRVVVSGAGEYGLTSLIVPKVSTSRRTTQGCAIYIWSTLNVGLCLPYLLITVSWHDHHGWLCRCQPARPLVFWVKHEGRPVAMFQNSLSSYQEECRSDGFALITELWLLSVLWSWFRISSHLSSIKLNHAELHSPSWLWISLHQK